MATASNTFSGSHNRLIAIDVRVWGMDINEKPFIQPAVARQLAEHSATLEGVIPVKLGDTIGVQFEKRKARFKVCSVESHDVGVHRRVGIQCVEDKNIWGIRFAIPIHSVGTAALYSCEEGDASAGDNLPDRRKSDRASCRVAAEVCREGEPGHSYAWVSDISLLGCYLQLLSPFTTGERLIVSLFAADLGMTVPLRLRGTVRASNPMVGMGVEFHGLNDFDRNCIQSLLHLLDRPKAKPGDSLRTPPPPPATAIFQVQQSESKSESLQDRATRLAMDLHQFQICMSGAGIDPRILQTLREATIHNRNVIGLVQQWMDLSSNNQDALVVLPEVASERLRMHNVLNFLSATDAQTR